MSHWLFILLCLFLLFPFFPAFWKGVFKFLFGAKEKPRQSTPEEKAEYERKQKEFWDQKERERKQRLIDNEKERIRREIDGDDLPF